MTTLMESLLDGRCSCGHSLVQTARQTMSSPAEYECPKCDLGLTSDEIERDLDDDGDARLDDYRDNREDWL